MNEQVDKRRTNREGTYDIKQLWQRSHEIIGMALLGHSNEDIAKVLNISRVTVSNTLNSPVGRDKLGDMRSERNENYLEVAKKVDKLTTKALKVYEEIFDSDVVSYELKKKVADTVALEMAGHRAPTEINTKSINLTASAAEIEEFKKRGVLAAKESGMIIDITEESNQITE